jgi:hypothetical protein
MNDKLALSHGAFPQIRLILGQGNRAFFSPSGQSRDLFFIQTFSTNVFWAMDLQIFGNKTVRAHTQTCTCTDIHMHVHRNTHTYKVYLHMHKDTQMSPYMYVDRHIFTPHMQTNMHSCAPTGVNTWRHTHTHIGLHACT